ncbi:hypothetical protein M595_4146 [Lyngbya aestuarii BL J]|uniref:Uncharacterized protein n=1 Tax=Lyngbya aestuarii BL J TaxID=1348334 RepID=U7QDM0_9CYAN|nr:hypothetical protein M595_4146 [Lyngbya aestuarii BL J]
MERIFGELLLIKYSTKLPGFIYHPEDRFSGSLDLDENDQVSEIELIIGIA